MSASQPSISRAYQGVGESVFCALLLRDLHLWGLLLLLLLLPRRRRGGEVGQR